jgi:long-chain acyl-CoA synthetase
VIEQYRTLVDHLDNHGESRGESCAIVQGSVRTTWRAFVSANRVTANGLTSMQIASQDRVAMLLDDPPTFLQVLFSVLRCGGVFVPLSTRLSNRSVIDALTDCQARLVISQEETNSELSRAIRGNGFQVASLRDITTVGSVEKDIRSVPTTPDANMSILYSSGTTDLPKGVLHTHSAREASLSRFIRRFAFDSQSVALFSSPIYTTNTLRNVLATMSAGGTCVFVRGVTPSDFLAILAKESVTFVALVPTQWSMLLRSPDFSTDAFRKCRYVTCGGAPLDRQLRHALVKLFGDRFIEGLGSTETDMITSVPDGCPPEKRGSVGVRYPDVDLRIVDGVGHEAAVGEIGDIVVSSSSNMKGYFNDFEATRAITWTDKGTGKTFIRSGDLGRLDADGFLWLVGRKKELIISGGNNIYPSDIESILLEHNDVLEAAVIGVPHELLGEIPIAFVVLDARSSPDRAREIRSWANRRLNRNQKLTTVTVLADLPKNPAGKVEKVQLVALHRTIA